MSGQEGSRKREKFVQKPRAEREPGMFCGTHPPFHGSLVPQERVKM